LIENRADTVKHATSPSHRDFTRQVVILSLFQIQPATPEHQNRSVATPLRLAHSFTRPSASHPLLLSDGRCVSLLFEANEARMPRLRNLNTEPYSSYRYEVKPDNRLESVANAHTAADLHVRPVSQTALVSRAVDAANIARDTSCPISRNGNDSTRASRKTTSRSRNQTVDFVERGKVLKLCEDSKHGAAVTFLTTAQNKFINWLRLIKAGRIFRTTLRHYADK
jgi:hypothetical protein